MRKKKRPPGQWHAPPKSARDVEFTENLRNWAARPPLPQYRLILALLGLFVLCGGMCAGFLVPSHVLVNDLRSRGVTTPAKVTAVDKNPRYVKVQFSGPSGVTNTNLSEISGSLPEAEPGTLLIITYDPEHPSRVLTQSWVSDPPLINLPVLLSAGPALLFLVGAVGLTLRRRWVLHTFGPPPDTEIISSTEKSGKPSIRLTKS
ncbi:DUF3592 domain-containing protein [Streptomyces sp. NBC_00859]|uniref:DUF3592 domain-containing protein n=1 Tax=Streptomyces sp. NBC_00859 TaxID=2903682 RepID=UPI003866B5DD|nr:DUF3592 domain-containing protein [Streptomyces sp. NBC_00859]